MISVKIIVPFSFVCLLVFLEGLLKSNHIIYNGIGITKVFKESKIEMRGIQVMRNLSLIFVMFTFLLTLSACGSDYKVTGHELGFPEDLEYDEMIGKTIQVTGAYLLYRVEDDYDSIFLDGNVQCNVEKDAVNFDDLEYNYKVKISGVVDTAIRGYILIEDCSLDKVYSSINKRYDGDDYEKWDFEDAFYDIIRVKGKIFRIDSTDQKFIVLEDENSEFGFSFSFHDSIDISDYAVGDEVTITGVSYAMSILAYKIEW